MVGFGGFEESWLESQRVVVAVAAEAGSGAGHFVGGLLGGEYPVVLAHSYIYAKK